MTKNKNLRLVKNISYDEIIKKISNECFNGDQQKAKKVY